MPDVRSGLDPKDYRFINPNPDPDFSPERNMAVVKQVQDETDKFLASYNKVLNQDGLNRRDVLSHFAKKVFSEHKSYDLKEYLGKQQYEALVGEKILSKIRIAQTTQILGGSNRLKKGLV